MTRFHPNSLPPFWDTETETGNHEATENPHEVERRYRKNRKSVEEFGTGPQTLETSREGVCPAVDNSSGERRRRIR